MKYVNALRALIIPLVLVTLMAIIPARPVSALGAISLSPASGPIGTQVTVAGAGFTPGNTVWVFFASEARTPVVVDSFGLINATIDIPTYATAGIAYISVRNGPSYAHSQLAIATFSVTEAVITLSASSGFVGEEIEVDGTGFAAGKTAIIYLDGDEVGSVVTSSGGGFTGAAFTIPESYRGSHTLQVKDTSNNVDTVTLAVKQSITISPATGTTGNTVTVNGTGFKASSDIIITFDGTTVATTPPAVVTSAKGSFSASFSVPATATTSHVIEASDGTNDHSQTFNTSPAAAGFSPLEGFAGDTVTVSVTGFRASQTVTITFGNQEVATETTNSDGSLSIDITVPELPGGQYRVRASDGINTKEDFYTVKVLASSSISPATSTSSPGNAGTVLTVSGEGFVTGRTVTVTFDDTRVATAPVDASGAFSAIFPAPDSSAGEHGIIVTDLSNIQQLTFTMESQAPQVPELLEPETDTKAEEGGLTRFTWEDISDPSGVSYTLQVADDAGFTEDSLLLEESRLTQPGYTLTEIDKLVLAGKETPYYWRVRAIDGASNASSWSGVRYFYVAEAASSVSLPQPLIYTLFGIGALLLGILGFWLGRKTAYY